MLLSKNKTKYLSSLKQKKFRDENRQFLAEGDKIVRDVLNNRNGRIKILVSTEEWLSGNQELAENIPELYTARLQDLERISSFETPPPVIAVFEIPATEPDYREVSVSLSVGLENIQDPGNLGTIIRTADWFGIRNIFCSASSADIYNPKVVQSSMGAVFNVKVHYTDFPGLLERLSGLPEYTILGTFMNGTPLSEVNPVRKGLLLFGNESRGLSQEYLRFIKTAVTIPAANPGVSHVESLNVASSVAIVLAAMTIS